MTTLILARRREPLQSLRSEGSKGKTSTVGAIVANMNGINDDKQHGVGTTNNKAVDKGKSSTIGRIIACLTRVAAMAIFVAISLLQSNSTMKATVNYAGTSLSATSMALLGKTTATMTLASAFPINVDDSRIDEDAKLIPLPELVRSAQAANTSCPPGATPILDTIRHHLHDDELPHRKIPRIIHITSKSRCATPKVQALVEQWRFANYSLFFHDDDAVDKLFRHPKSQKTFPLLNETLMCVTNGATKADLWRYLALYTYGGVYTDIDDSPVGFNEHTIQPDDDSWFPIEGLGIVAQFFFASSPGHPVMKYAIDFGIQNLRNIVNVMRNNPARSTGPGALKNAFIMLMNGTSNGYIDAGLYKGISSPRNMTVVGSKTNSAEYVNRQGLNAGDKSAYYKALGIEHFHQTSRYPQQGRISCMEHIRRTNGTYKVAKYRFDEATGQYVEA